MSPLRGRGGPARSRPGPPPATILDVGRRSRDALRRATTTSETLKRFKTRGEDERGGMIPLRTVSSCGRPKVTLKKINKIKWNKPLPQLSAPAAFPHSKWRRLPRRPTPCLRGRGYRARAWPSPGNPAPSGRGRGGSRYAPLSMRVPARHRRVRRRSAPRGSTPRPALCASAPRPAPSPSPALPRAPPRARRGPAGETADPHRLRQRDDGAAAGGGGGGSSRLPRLPLPWRRQLGGWLAGRGAAHRPGGAPPHGPGREGRWDPGFPFLSLASSSSGGGGCGAVGGSPAAVAAAGVGVGGEEGVGGRLVRLPVSPPLPPRRGRRVPLPAVRWVAAAGSPRPSPSRSPLPPPPPPRPAAAAGVRRCVCVVGGGGGGELGGVPPPWQRRGWSWSCPLKRRGRGKKGEKGKKKKTFWRWAGFPAAGFQRESEPSQTGGRTCLRKGGENACWCVTARPPFTFPNFWQVSDAFARSMAFSANFSESQAGTL